MKRFLLIVLAALVAIAADTTPQQKYISKYSALAQSEMRRTGVPASITLAQGILESNSGQSRLAVKGNNHFGIKCHSDWKGDRMYHDDDEKGECFRVYPSAEHSFRDHSDFLRYYSRYKSLFELDPTDYKSWATGLKAAGYATSPSYATSLIKIIETYKLYQFDSSESVPETPAQIEAKSDLPAALVKVSYKYSASRTSKSGNGVPYVIAIDGDSYESLAKEYNLFTKEILSFNDLSGKQELAPGTIVYLQRKKSIAPKGLDKYIVEFDGQELRDICQLFAVREKSIKKLNGFTKEVSLKEGDTIKLR